VIPTPKIHVSSAAPSETLIPLANIESLPGVADQSRSIFAERFSAILGEGAAHYPARLRIQLSRELLVQSGMSVAEVASR